MTNVFRWIGSCVTAAMLAAATVATGQSFAIGDDNVYAPPALPSGPGGVNEGGVNFALTVSYLTDYVYRGIDRSEVGGNEDVTRHR